MDGLENIAQELKSTENAVTEKPKEVVEVSDYESSIKTIEEEIKNDFCSFGEAVFNIEKDSLDSAYRMFIDPILAKYEQIEEIKRKIKVTGNKSLCVVCGSEIGENALFCSHCGTKIEREKKTNIPKILYCSNCGTALRENASFCVECGAKIR